MTQVVSQDILRVRFPTVKTTEPWDMSISAYQYRWNRRRQCGIISQCYNPRDIRGRKDAGGIVGQFELHI